MGDKKWLTLINDADQHDYFFPSEEDNVDPMVQAALPYMYLGPGHALLQSSTHPATTVQALNSWIMTA